MYRETILSGLLGSSKPGVRVNPTLASATKPECGVVNAVCLFLRALKVPEAMRQVKLSDSIGYHGGMSLTLPVK